MICLMNRKNLIEAPIRFLNSFGTLGIYQEWDEDGTENFIFVEKVGNYTFHVL